MADERGSDREANWRRVKERVTGRLGGCATGRGAVANWCRAKERVTGRLGGCATGRGAAAGWVGSATGAAG